MQVSGSEVEQNAKLHQSGVMGAVLCHPGYGGPSQYVPHPIITLYRTLLHSRYITVY